MNNIYTSEVLSNIFSTLSDISFNDICYEHIKDTFYYGFFEGFKIVVDKTTGCFNATKLCEQGEKNYFNWARLEKTKKMIEYYRNYYQKDINIYEVKGSNNDKTEKKITGTYITKDFFSEIVNWMKFKKVNKNGFVYVITNSNIEPIRKIGFTQDVEARLATFNLYRDFEPCYYTELVYQSENAKELESKVHLALNKYSVGKEFFKVSLDQVEKVFQNLGYTPIQRNK